MNEPQVHPSSIVYSEVPQPHIGYGTKVWHFCHIMGGAFIGNNCTIGDYVFIGRDVTIGDRCKIQNGAQLFEGVVLKEDVFIGPGVIFTNVKRPRAYKRQPYISTLIKTGATIGANSTIVCGVIIGEDSMVGAGAVVTKDVPDGALVYGNPAKKRRGL